MQTEERGATKRRPGAVALSRAFPRSTRISYSRLCSTLVMLVLWMLGLPETPDGSGRPCVGVLSEAPYGSGRPALPPYMRVEQHVVLEQREQGDPHWRRMPGMPPAQRAGGICEQTARTPDSTQRRRAHTSAQPRVRKRADGRSATAHRHVLTVQKSRSRTANRCNGRWHSIPTRLDPHPRGPALHTANWLALHARLTWMIAGPSGTND